MKRVWRRLGRVAKWFYKTRKRGTLTSLILFVLICVAAIVHYLNAPSQGHAITDANLSKAVATTQSTPAPSPAQTVSSSLFTLNLPPGYNVQGHQQVPSSLLYDQTITKPGDFGTLIIAIAVENLPSGGLAGDTSYTVRTQQPAEYQMSTKTYAGGTVYIASDNSTSSVVAFWPHGAYLATVSISSGTDAPSGDNNADELNALSPLLSARQWQ